MKKRAEGKYVLFFSPEKGEGLKEKTKKEKGKGMGLVHKCLHLNKQKTTKQNAKQTHVKTQKTHTQTHKSKPKPTAIPESCFFNTGLNNRCQSAT